MMLRTMSIICVIAAAAMLAWTAYSTLRPDVSTDPSFVVAPTELDLGTIPIGDRALAFDVTNSADRPRRIIGLKEG